MQSIRSFRGSYCFKLLILTAGLSLFPCVPAEAAECHFLVEPFPTSGDTPLYRDYVDRGKVIRQISYRDLDLVRDFISVRFYSTYQKTMSFTVTIGSANHGSMGTYRRLGTYVITPHSTHFQSGGQWYSTAFQLTNFKAPIGVNGKLSGRYTFTVNANFASCSVYARPGELKPKYYEFVP